MKRCNGLAIVLCICLLLVGCNQQTDPPAPTGTSKLQTFESYVTKTSFSFPNTWEYQQDDQIDDGTTALFLLPGGRVAVQFLWMDAAQQAKNVFLQQLDIDEVVEQAKTAGAYEGTLVSGVEGQQYTLAFEGSRSWYDGGQRLFCRAVLEADGEQSFTDQRPQFLAMLDSLGAIADGEIQTIAQEQWDNFNFIEDYGLQFRAPTVWWMVPDHDPEHGYVALTFNVANGNNEYRIEKGTVDQKTYQSLVDSLKALEHDEDIYDYHYEQANGLISMSCLQQGKINRVQLRMKKSGDKVTYLWVSTALVPPLDQAYTNAEIKQSIDSIQWN